MTLLVVSFLSANSDNLIFPAEFVLGGFQFSKWKKSPFSLSLAELEIVYFFWRKISLANAKTWVTFTNTRRLHFFINTFVSVAHEDWDEDEEVDGSESSEISELNADVKADFERYRVKLPRGASSQYEHFIIPLVINLDNQRNLFLTFRLMSRRFIAFEVLLSTRSSRMSNITQPTLAWVMINTPAFWFLIKMEISCTRALMHKLRRWWTAMMSGSIEKKREMLSLCVRACVRAVHI